MIAMQHQPTQEIVFITRDEQYADTDADQPTLTGNRERQDRVVDQLWREMESTQPHQSDWFRCLYRAWTAVSGGGR